MAELTVERTYATALYQAAVESGNEERVMNDSTELLELLDENKDLNKLFLSPAISAKEKKEIIMELFDGKLADELVNFMCIIIEKRRFVSLPRMIREYKRLYEHKEGIVEGTIYSVEALSEDRIKKFEEETGKLLGENIELTNEIDEELIGGVRIMVSGRIIDASIKSRLNRLASEIRL